MQRGGSGSPGSPASQQRWRGRVVNNYTRVSGDVDFVLASDALDLVGGPGRRIAPILGGVKSAMNELQVEACERPATVLGVQGSAFLPELLGQPLDLPMEQNMSSLSDGDRPPTSPATPQGSRGSERTSIWVHGAEEFSPTGASLFSDRASTAPSGSGQRRQSGSPRKVSMQVAQPTEPPVACDLAKSCIKVRRPELRLGSSSCEFSDGSASTLRAVKRATIRVDEDEGTYEDLGSSSGLQGKSRRDAASKAAELLPSPKHNGSRLHGKRGAVNRGNVGVEFVTELTVYDAYSLSRRFNLPPGQVTQAWKMFKRYDLNDIGALTNLEFQTLIRSVLRDRYPKAKDIPREIFDRAVSQGDQVTFVYLLQWMNETSFSEHLLLSTEQRFIRDIARQHNVPLLEVEQIKRHFDKFDADNSGAIEYHEFKDLLHMLLGVKEQGCLPEARVVMFWRELDNDASGGVAFKEFIPWYLGYFHDSSEASPLEAFYRNIRPVPFYHKSSDENH